MLGNRSISASALCIALAPLTGALPQSSQNLEEPGDPDDVVLLPFGTRRPDPFRRSAAADFNGDGLADLIVQRGTDLEMLFGPDCFELHLGPFCSANDLAVLPGAGAGDLPTLFTVGVGGLVQRVWDDSSPSFWDDLTLAQGEWVNAKHVTVMQVSGQPPALFGVKEDQRTVLRYDLASQTTQVVVWVPQNIQDLQAVRFLTDPPAPHLAVMTGTQLFVYSSTGGLLLSSGSSPASHASVPVCQSTSSLEQILWFITGPGSANEFLISLDPAGPLVQNNFGGLPGIVACTRGDVDGDGDDDLLFSHQSDRTLVVLYNAQGNALHFKQNIPGAQQEVLRYGTGAAPENQAQPAWVDIDNDGDLDVLFPVELESMVLLEENALSSPAESAPSLVLREDDTAGDVSFEGGVVTVSLEFTAPLRPGADRLELVVWRKENHEDPTDPLYDPPTTFAPSSQGAEDASFEVDVLLESTGPVHFLLLRWISSGGPSVAPRFPARMYALQFGLWDDYLAPPLRIGNFANLGTLGLPGTICEIVRIPGISEDNPPRPR